MSGPDDTLPPESHSTPTLPAPASSRGELPIRDGDAQFAVSQAMDRLTDAVMHVERIAMALARQLDAQPK